MTEKPTNLGGVAADQLRSFIERIERLEEEKKAISDDIKDVYAEAKGNGYDDKDHAQDHSPAQAGQATSGRNRKPFLISICTRWAWQSKALVGVAAKERER